jgi:erythromycin esterase
LLLPWLCGTAGAGTISGIVLDEGGRPVAGATVAAITRSADPTIASVPAAVTTSDTAGRFPAMTLSPGSYAVTATAPGRTAAYHAEVVVSADSAEQVELSMSGDSITLAGTLRDLDGRVVESVQVRAIRISESLGDVFVAADVDGDWSLTVPRAKYVVEAEAGDLRSEYVNAFDEEDQTVDLVMRPPPGPPGPEVSRWLAENVIPLATVEAGHGFDDMQPLRSLIGDARIVSLGEATHGTHEFFQLKHRMLEFLVEEMGFSVFAIEASFPDALAVNDFVLRGEGEPAEALAGLGFWTWNTEEVLEQILWMRAYNEDPAHATKVEFWGFDMQAPIASVGRLLALLRSSAPDLVSDIEPLVDRLSSQSEYASLDVAEQEETRRTLADLRERLEDRRAPADPGSRDDWALAVQLVDLILQGEELFRSPRGSTVRDRAMAANVSWIHDRQPPGTGIVLWAHNAHVDFARDARMGWHLRAEHGDGLVTFGFVFHRGGFRAMDAGADRRGLVSFQVGPAPEGSLDAALAGAVPAIAALDLRSIPESGPVATWFRTPRDTRSFGALFDESVPDYGLARMAVAQSYDTLLFVEETTAAIGVRARKSARPAAAAARNLDFEAGELGGSPPDWLLPETSAAGGFRAAVVEDEPRSSRAAQLDRRGPLTRPSPFGNLMQKIDAAPYRGRTVRYRASVRRSDESASRAQLWIRVDRENGDTGFFDNMGDRPIVSTEWAEYEITGAVAEDAASISFGVMLFGRGPVWIDDVSLEIVESGS